MNFTNYVSNFNPSEEQMEEIYSWSTFPSSSFSSIHKCYQQKNICLAMLNNTIIGFCAYRLSPKCIFINIAETQPKFQGKGVMKFILQQLSEHLSIKGYLAFHLYCAPEESQHTWKKLGFDYYPKSKYGKRSSKIEMFKIFGESCIIKPAIETENRKTKSIEIWNCLAGKDDGSPTWVAEFDLIENTNKLKKPFIFFGDKDWNIKINTLENSKFYRYKDYDRRSEVEECFYIDELK